MVFAMAVIGRLAKITVTRNAIIRKTIDLEKDELVDIVPSVNPNNTNG